MIIWVANILTGMDKAMKNKTSKPKKENSKNGKKRTPILILTTLMLLSITAFAESLGVLEGILKPVMIKVFDDEDWQVFVEKIK
jgi:hypothetical protein